MKKLCTHFGFDKMFLIVPSLNFVAIQSRLGAPVAQERDPPQGKFSLLPEREGRNSLRPCP